MAYKVGVRAPSDRDWFFNELQFDMLEEAQEYARDLKLRWPAVIVIVIANLG